MFRVLLFSSLIFSFTFSFSQEQFSFYRNGTYLPGIPLPDEVLNFQIGDRPIRYDEVIEYFKALSEKSSRVKMFESGETHEKRKLYYLVISSEENISRLDEIKSKMSKLSDPRKINEEEADQIENEIPVVAWMMYSIHGDELSGTDASVQLAYQLVAGTDSSTLKILKNVITGIDPMENPDGRERYLAMMEQWKGNIISSDIQSMQHVGSWPYGRTNHYLFDLNRDWFILAHPETRARVKAIVDWNPQLVVDVHEQGAYSTYYFNPPREPLNLNISSSIKNWWKIFSRDQAKAFDDYNWSYYTRESYDDWYPGFGSSLPYYHGAVGILYEQASTDGSPVKRPDGTTITYKDAVHHQFISSIANLKTAAENSKEFLKQYLDGKKESLEEKTSVTAYLIDPSKNKSRADKLIEKILYQGIEVSRADEDFSLSVKSYFKEKDGERKFPKGSYIIKTSQPLKPLINTLFEFDPRMTTDFLKTERESLEKGKETQFYEVAAWSFPMAYDVDAFSTESKIDIKSVVIENVIPAEGTVINGDAKYGYLIDYKDDNAIYALLMLFKKNYKIRAAEKEFKINGKKFGRGTLLVRTNENSEKINKDIKIIAEAASVEAYGINTALAEEGPDIGGNDFELLEKPEIGLFTGSSLNTSSFGSLWYLFDYELKYPHSILSIDLFNQLDLRKYNVLIFPSSSSYKKEIGKDGLEKLKSWVSNGGTLISIGDASAFFADTSNGLSNVKLRQQALKDLESYEEAYDKEKNAFNISIDSLEIWEGKISETKNEKKDEKKVDLVELARREEREKVFMPRGAILNVELNEEHWLNYGLGKNVPAIVYTSNVYLSKNPVETAARFSGEKSLRLSGLLWPEALKQWQKSAYATRESTGNGQIIFFAGDPVFRSYFYGTERMLLNAIFLGPGFGSNQTVRLE